MAYVTKATKRSMKKKKILKNITHVVDKPNYRFPNGLPSVT